MSCTVCIPAYPTNPDRGVLVNPCIVQNDESATLNGTENNYVAELVFINGEPVWMLVPVGDDVQNLSGQDMFTFGGENIEII